MIKRTIEISQQPVHVSVRLDQLLLQPHDRPAGKLASIPCEDIGMVLVDQNQVTYSHAALATLARFGAALVVCGRDHLPAAVMLPVAGHGEVVWRINEQLSASRPLKKRLWKQLVQAKIRAQAANLPDGSSRRSRLLTLARSVRSGDPTNVEAQAARQYWTAWAPHSADQPRFRRDPDGADPLNAMLNYGYAVLRAAVARSLVGAGLLPAISLHHRSRSDNFCLADDLVEPLRPLVDRRVHELFTDGRRSLDQPTKAQLLRLLADPVRLGDESGPLMVQIHRMIASLVKCYRSQADELEVPTLAA